CARSEIVAPAMDYW
nr:immunoglobulin heavy chain junction region [Mus musculus]MBK4185427.1 immunoglobulin heavy chain junction region [Mus musculus]